MPTKTDKGWFVDFHPRGRNSKRFRKTFPTKAEALRYKNNILSTYTEEWNETRKDTRHLSELIELWYQHFGVALKAGKQRHRVLVLLSESLFNPVASSLDTSLLTDLAV